MRLGKELSYDQFHLRRSGSQLYPPSTQWYPQLTYSRCSSHMEWSSTEVCGPNQRQGRPIRHSLRKRSRNRAQIRIVRRRNDRLTQPIIAIGLVGERRDNSLLISDNERGQMSHPRTRMESKLG